MYINKRLGQAEKPEPPGDYALYSFMRPIFFLGLAYVAYLIFFKRS